MDIIDCHAHLGTVNSMRAPWDLLNISAEDLLRGMDANAVKLSCIFGVPQPSMAVLEECRRHNDVVGDAVRRYPDRFVGVCVTTPHTGNDMGIGEIRRTVERYGFKGVKFQSNRMGFDLRVDVLAPIFETCIELNIPVLIHTGEDRTSPDRVGYLALAYPKLIVVMLHMGLRTDYQLYAIEVARLTPNIILETSFAGAWSIRRAISLLGAERVMFGSDSPYGSLGDQIRALRSMNLKPEEEAMTFVQNARRVFRM